MNRRGGAFVDRGSLTLYFVLLVPTLLVLAALVVDAGQLLAARRDVQDVAQNAARAGAQAVDLSTVHDDAPAVLAPRAVARAHAWLRAEGASGRVAATGDRVTVTVQRDVPTVLLGVIGLPSRRVAATATARIVRGITRTDT